MSSFKGTLKPYQRDAVRWMADREHTRPFGGFLCDEMGLGKTVELIALATFCRVAKTLVICPKNIAAQWCSEIRHFSALRVLQWDGPARSRDPLIFNRYDVVVVPYSLMSEQGTTIHRVNWNRIILDEAHEIRNDKSARYKSIARLTTKNMWLVSGTPIFNSERDFASLASLLKIPRRDVNMFMEIIAHKYVLRRTKTDLNINLALCDFQNVELDMSTGEQSLYKFMYLVAKHAVHGIKKLECYLRTRQILTWPQTYLDGIARQENRDPEIFEGQTAKMDTLLSMIETHPTEKALVFCHFLGEMAEIKRRLKLIGRKTFTLCGAMDQDHKQRDIDRFSESGYEGAVFVIQIKAGGVGLNLQAASRVYITGPHWNPAIELQAIARAHRTGQTKPVVVRKLVYKGTEELPSVEESIMALQGHKSIICAEILNDPRLENQLPAISARVKALELSKLFV